MGRCVPAGCLLLPTGCRRLRGCRWLQGHTEQRGSRDQPPQSMAKSIASYRLSRHTAAERGGEPAALGRAGLGAEGAQQSPRSGGGEARRGSSAPCPHTGAARPAAPAACPHPGGARPGPGDPAGTSPEPGAPQEGVGGAGPGRLREPGGSPAGPAPRPAPLRALRPAGGDPAGGGSAGRDPPARPPEVAPGLPEAAAGPGAGRAAGGEPPERGAPGAAPPSPRTYPVTTGAIFHKLSPKLLLSRELPPHTPPLPLLPPLPPPPAPLAPPLPGTASRMRRARETHTQSARALPSDTTAPAWEPARSRESARRWGEGKEGSLARLGRWGIPSLPARASGCPAERTNAGTAGGGGRHTTAAQPARGEQTTRGGRGGGAASTPGGADH